VVSNYLTVLITGRYTGDFIGVPPELSGIGLLLNFIYTLTPLVILFSLYKHYAQQKTRYKISIPIRALGIYLLISLPFDILVSVLYGVGKSGSDGTYNVPMALRLIIIFANRLDPYFGTYLYSVITPRRNKLKYLFMILLIILSLTRASLNALMAILLVNIMVQYQGGFLKFIKKRLILVIIGILLLPGVAVKLYQLRSELRGSSSGVAGLSVTGLIFGTVIGRLSSYTNSAILIERKSSYIPIVKNNITLFQFPWESLPLPRSFEKMGYGHVLVTKPGNTFFSPGTSGVMTIGYYHSGLALLVNIITVFTLLSLTFKLCSLFHYTKIRELFFLFLCGPIVEGAALGFTKYIQSIIMYSAIFLLINFLSKWNKA
jgi:hypothetical protein